MLPYRVLIEIAVYHSGSYLDLVSGLADRLFATTDHEWMRKTLSKAGFLKKGKEWPGQRGMLSLGAAVIG